jgi:hypothetical protein
MLEQGRVQPINGNTDDLLIFLQLLLTFKFSTCLVREAEGKTDFRHTLSYRSES